MLTEYEWRRQVGQRSHRNASICGAQCVLETSHGKRLIRDRSFHVFLLLLSFSVAAVLPMFVPVKEKEVFSQVYPVTETKQQPRQISTISYRLPQYLEYRQHTFTQAELLRGNMLLIDAEHPLPPNVPFPNTLSIAVYGKGRVPVRNLQLKSGKETINNLAALFISLQSRQIAGLMVFDATHSRAEQQALLEEHTRSLMGSLSPNEAVEQALQSLDWPGTGELQQEYTVEIRPASADSSRSWQELLQNAWKYGFVRSTPNVDGREEYRFRWVGNAHATAMTYLNLSLKDYLLWLHEKRCLVIEEKEKIRYLILCQPMNGTHTAFMLPEGADVEVSLDNMGYAVAACTF